MCWTQARLHINSPLFLRRLTLVRANGLPILRCAFAVTSVEISVAMKIRSGRIYRKNCHDCGQGIQVLRLIPSSHIPTCFVLATVLAIALASLVARGELR